MSRYTLHSLVWQDISEIWEFIASDNPGAANRVEDELFAAFELLFWVVRNYLIAYETNSNPLAIVMVIHA